MEEEFDLDLGEAVENIAESALSVAAPLAVLGVVAYGVAKMTEGIRKQ